jgi:hypothetical protein
VFGLGMELYFASQGAGRLLWPLLANMARLVIAAAGGWLALYVGGGVSGVFLALARSSRLAASMRRRWRAGRGSRRGADWPEV